MASRKEHVSYFVQDGYARWRDRVCHESLFVHQLTAIMAGEEPQDVFDESNVIHHENTHKFDNRPENLQLMTTSEHSKHHYTEIEENKIVTEEGCERICSDYPDQNLERISDELDICVSTVWKHLSGGCEHHNKDHTHGYDGPRDGPWRDYNVFYKNYVQKGKPMKQLAQEWDCSTGTVSNWKQKHGITQDNR